MLNCILSMVEKTKRALAILQERENVVTSNDGVVLTNGINGEHGSASRRHNGDDVKRTVNELIAHTVRLTEEKVAYVRRKAGRQIDIPSSLFCLRGSNGRVKL